MYIYPNSLLKILGFIYFLIIPTYGFSSGSDPVDPEMFPLNELLVYDGENSYTIQAPPY